jgi:hypothetical protein
MKKGHICPLIIDLSKENSDWNYFVDEIANQVEPTKSVADSDDTLSVPHVDSNNIIEDAKPLNPAAFYIGWFDLAIRGIENLENFMNQSSWKKADKLAERLKEEKIFLESMKIEFLQDHQIQE